MILLDQLFTICKIESAEASFDLTIELNPSHQIFEGHFPGFPILPGVCMMQMVKEITEKLQGKKLQLVNASYLKFLQPINPNEDTILIMTLFCSAIERNINVIASLSNTRFVCFKFKGLFT